MRDRRSARPSDGGRRPSLAKARAELSRPPTSICRGAREGELSSGGQLTLPQPGSLSLPTATLPCAPPASTHLLPQPQRHAQAL